MSEEQFIIVPKLTYFLITRKIFESPIWYESPHVLKLFIYLVGTARHSKTPKKYNGFKVGRGELVTSLADISTDNEYLNHKRLKKWSRAKVSRMLSHLKGLGYINILADTYGTHISICNYDYYQSQATYKVDSSGTAAEQQRNGSETVASINNNDKNDKNEKTKLPIWLPLDLWNEFKKLRVKLKKPLTVRAEKLNLKELEKLKDKGNDPVKVIERTIMRGWQGFFPLKENQKDDTRNFNFSVNQRR